MCLMDKGTEERILSVDGLLPPAPDHPRENVVCSSDGCGLQTKLGADEDAANSEKLQEEIERNPTAQPTLLDVGSLGWSSAVPCSTDSNCFARVMQRADESRPSDFPGGWHIEERHSMAGEICSPDFQLLQSMLTAQRDEIIEQLHELQKLAVLQCRITGTNPLAQEMAGAVLEKRVGKKLGDSLTSKALKCLYNVFSIKDTITKKEAREISALCGATVTQVREFFTEQRSRVRRVVHSSHVDQPNNSLFQSIQLEQLPRLGVHSGENTVTCCPDEVANSQSNNHLFLERFCGKLDGSSSKLYAAEKAEQLINAMRKENSFMGQSQLAEVIMRAHGSVLRCFIARGGLQQISRWMVQAAAEEQTSLIRLILKVITDLPLGSAPPRNMSQLLQTVNKLRFYRAQDIAGRARSLLVRWSRFCKSTQSGKILPSTDMNTHSQSGQKRSSLSNTLDDTSTKKLKAENEALNSGQTADVLSLPLNEDKTMNERSNSETVTQGGNTKKRLGSSLIHGDRMREKRKVQLFEETRAANRRRDAEGLKSSSFDPSPRPLSADDIKKAKRRAFFQNNAKDEKPLASNLDGSLTLDLATVSFERGQKRRTGNAGQPKGIQDISSRVLASDDPESVPGQTHGDTGIQKETGSSLLPLVCRMSVEKLLTSSDEHMFPRIHWTMPPRIILDPQWKVATGEQSTEIHSEYRRLNTVSEVIYPSYQLIPSNPAEPAERICLFVDDTLVPEILLEAVEEDSMENDNSLQSAEDPHLGVYAEVDSQMSGANMDNRVGQGTLVSPAAGDLLIDGSEMAGKVSQLCRVDQQVEFLTTAAQEESIKPVVKSVNNQVAVTSTSTFSSQLEPVDEALGLVNSYSSNSTIYDTGHEIVLFQQITESNPACTDQIATMVLPAVHVSPTEPIQALTGDNLNSAQRQRDYVTFSGSVTGGKLVDQLGEPGSSNKASTIDLSELSKEACMDMLNIVLQQLADNAVSSGADLELLSVFLKNPELVYSLTSSQVVSLDRNGLSSAATGRDLYKVISNSTTGNSEMDLQKLACRNIGQSEHDTIVANIGQYGSGITQPSNQRMGTVVDSESYQMVSAAKSCHSAIKNLTIQLPNSQNKTADTSQSLKPPLMHEDNYVRSLDCDWSKTCTYPTRFMQQTTAMTCHAVDASVAVNVSNNSNASSLSQTHSQPYLTRVSLPQGSQLCVDQHNQSSLSMFAGAPGQPSSTILEPEEHGKETMKGNGFCNDLQSSQILSNTHVVGTGSSDGLLPAPDKYCNNHRVYQYKPVHESYAIPGGKIPTSSAEVRASPGVMGHHMTLSNGHSYHDLRFAPHPTSGLCPPYLSHGQGSVVSSPSSMRVYRNSKFLRPPFSHSDQSSHHRSQWREG
ncbi:hypothetical protein KP509_26G026900 [Ceratopteris richardii]|uniref:Homeobox domain-containing protein n=1 Tax=Ceratopteris richardii TaxID=49495 RepID=A0A8T2RM01_CERRI|nr:hypothetical protein KP509_26G026900 [Ceratopteris richardii]